MPPAAHVLAFLLVFTVLFLFALAATITAEFLDVKWVLTIVRIGEGLGRLTLVSIAIAFILVEGVPMLAAWYKKQMDDKAREEGRDEGRASERKAWLKWARELEEWERRRLETELSGMTFREPRPASPDAEQGNPV